MESSEYLRCIPNDDVMGVNPDVDVNTHGRHSVLAENISAGYRNSVNRMAPPSESCPAALMTDDCVHLQYSSSWKCHKLAAEQLLIGQTVGYGKAGGTARPSQYKSHLLCYFSPAIH